MSIWLIIVLGFIAFSFVLVVFVFFKQHSKKRLGQKELNYIHSHWVRIIDMFSGNPKSSISDADKLLDYVLKLMGFEGTLGEKLKKAGARFSNKNAVWAAHKLRNQVAHELGDINIDEARSALKAFKQALNDLGARL